MLVDNHVMQIIRNNKVIEGARKGLKEALDAVGLDEGKKIVDKTIDLVFNAIGETVDAKVPAIAKETVRSIFFSVGSGLKELVNKTLDELDSPLPKELDSPLPKELDSPLHPPLTPNQHP